MTKMFSTRTAVLLIALVAGLAPAALAQSTMVKGKVIGANKEPMVGVAITIEFQGGVNRKLETKTDKRGEFIQLLTEGGQYKITATDPKIGSVSNMTVVRLGRVSDMVIVLVPTTAANDAAKAAELKKAFEEGVTASRGGNMTRRSKSSRRPSRWRPAASTATSTSASPTWPRRMRRRRRRRGSRRSR